jgi:ubiquinone/menaquinone biosynthesis C-methylase UbiE
MASLGDTQDLSQPAYWDDRYENQDADGYDWFKTFSEIAAVLTPHLKPSSKIMVLGCGTSSLSEDLYQSGYHHIFSNDFSAKCIDLMSCRKQDKPEMHWDVCDVRTLEVYDDDSFDVVIDKGVMDAMLDGCSLWDPPEQVKENCAREIQSAARVLKSGGKFLMISFRPSHFLRPRVQSELWAHEPVIEQIGSFYYSVVAVKR